MMQIPMTGSSFNAGVNPLALTPDMSNLGGLSGASQPPMNLLGGMSQPSSVPTMDNPQSFLAGRFGAAPSSPPQSPSILNGLSGQSGQEKVIVVPIIINGANASPSPAGTNPSMMPTGLNAPVRMGAGNPPPMAFNGTPMTPVAPNPNQLGSAGTMPGMNNPATALTVNALGGPTSEVGNLYNQVQNAQGDIKNLLASMNTNMQGMLAGGGNPQAMVNSQQNPNQPMPTNPNQPPQQGLGAGNMPPNPTRMGGNGGMPPVDPNASIKQQAEMAKQMSEMLKAQKGKGSQAPRGAEGSPDEMPPEALASREGGPAAMPSSSKEASMQKRIDKLEAMVAQLLEDKESGGEMPPRGGSPLASRERGGQPMPTRMGSSMPRGMSPQSPRLGTPQETSEEAMGDTPSGMSENRSTQEALALIAKYDAKLKQNLQGLQSRLGSSKGNTGATRGMPQAGMPA